MNRLTSIIVRGKRVSPKNQNGVEGETKEETDGRVTRRFSSMSVNAMETRKNDLYQQTRAKVALVGWLDMTEVYLDGEQQSIGSPTRALIDYIASLANEDPLQTEVDLDHARSLINNGASVKCTDRYGQTVVHEVARLWAAEVAVMLIEVGADTEQSDAYGRTALHVAAAMDRDDIIKTLLENGAEINANTKGEDQTPLHFAARNDGVNAMKVLIKNGADIEDRDYKKRTPLQVAVELDRCEAAQYLVEIGASARVEDDDGLSVMTLMIVKMPSVAIEAMEQIHLKDRTSRREFFFLNYLENRRPTALDESHCPRRTPLEVAVWHRSFEILMHPLFLRLIDLKWNSYGRQMAFLQFMYHALFVLCWTTIGISTPSYAKDSSGEHYGPLEKRGWRIVLIVFAILMTLAQIWQELNELLFYKKRHCIWAKWREEDISKDFEYCHPCWPGERDFLEVQLKNLKKLGPSYFKDAWNFMDWVVFLILIISTVSHFVDVGYATYHTRDVHVKVVAFSLVFLWLRLMKYMRPFSFLGPFIVIFGQMLGDIIRFLVFYSLFLIPFACSFWMIFGGKVDDYRDFGELVHSLIQVTLGGSYNIEGLKEVDKLMAIVLSICYTIVSAITCLNLFIALMSDTFQRVYENSQANALLQKASTILALQTFVSIKRRRDFYDFIQTKCAPEERFYQGDDIMPGNMQRLTQNIKDQIDEIQETVEHGLKAIASPDDLTDNMNQFRNKFKELESAQRRQTETLETLGSDLTAIKNLLLP